MHLPPPPVAPTASGRPCGGRHPPHRKNRERRRRAGSNGDASVKRRSGVRASRTQRRVCVCAPRGTAEARAGRRRQLLSPGGQLPHYPLPPRARPRARCTTRLAPLLWRSAVSRLYSAIDIRIVADSRLPTVHRSECIPCYARWFSLASGMHRNYFTPRPE